MSRTYRKRKDPKPWSLCWKFDVIYQATGYIRVLKVPADYSEEEVKKEMSKYRADGYKEFKEPGPSWYRNILVERPQRREAKRELRKFMNNEEYEPMLLPKNPLEYWT